MIGIVTAWMVAMSITNFLLCMPLNAYWDIFYKGHQVCFQEVPYYVSFSAVDLVLDVVVCTLPLFIIIPLQLPKRQKYILAATFAVGLL
jgi:ABC-type sulfate transport system permease subunit